MVQGKINRGKHTDHPAGRHSIRTNLYLPVLHHQKPVTNSLLSYLVAESVLGVEIYQSQLHIIHAEIHQAAIDMSSVCEPAANTNEQCSQLSLTCVSEPEAVRVDSTQADVSAESSQTVVDQDMSSMCEPPAAITDEQCSQLSVAYVSEPAVEPKSAEQNKNRSQGKNRVSVLDISPYPHVVRKFDAKRRAESSCLLTSTPVKKAMEEKCRRKATICRKRLKVCGTDSQENDNNIKQKIKRIEYTTEREKKRTKDQGKGGHRKAKELKSKQEQVKKKAEFAGTKLKAKKSKSACSKKPKQTASNSEPCLYCSETVNVGKWIQCQICTKWAHYECAGADDNDFNFICEMCN